MIISTPSTQEQPDCLTCFSEDKDIRFNAIADQISNLWIETDKNICIGAVFSWIVNDCPNRDNTNLDIQKTFDQFQNAYSSNRGSPEEDTTYLPDSTLENYKLKEAPTQNIQLDGKSSQEIAQLIIDEWNFLNRKRHPTMIIISHPAQSHAYGINKNDSDHYQLFDIRLGRCFEAKSLDDFKLGIEAHFIGLTTVFQERKNGQPTDSFTEIQFISYSAD